MMYGSGDFAEEEKFTLPSPRHADVPHLHHGLNQCLEGVVSEGRGAPGLVATDAAARLAPYLCSHSGPSRVSQSCPEVVASKGAKDGPCLYKVQGGSLVRQGNTELANQQPIFQLKSGREI